MWGVGVAQPDAAALHHMQVVGTRDRVAGAGFACNARPPPSATHFLLISKSLRRIEIGKKAIDHRQEFHETSPDRWVGALRRGTMLCQKFSLELSSPDTLLAIVIDLMTRPSSPAT
jgi:hypothetical protein